MKARGGRSGQFKLGNRTSWTGSSFELLSPMAAAGRAASVPEVSFPQWPQQRGKPGGRNLPMLFLLVNPYWCRASCRVGQGQKQAGSGRGLSPRLSARPRPPPAQRRRQPPWNSAPMPARPIAHLHALNEVVSAQGAGEVARDMACAGRGQAGVGSNQLLRLARGRQAGGSRRLPDLHCCKTRLCAVEGAAGLCLP